MRRDLSLVCLLAWLSTAAFACDEGADTVPQPGVGGEGAGGAAGHVAEGGQTSDGGSVGAGGDGGEDLGAGGALQVPPFPDPDWTVADPADHGLDPAALDAAAAAAEASGSHCLVVVRHGAIVAEHYFQGRHAGSRDKSFSIAKSYTGALVGIALERGDIESLDQSVADFIPSWQGTDHEAVTVRHLLSMQSGLKWTLISDYVSMATLAWNHTAYALGLQQEKIPGSEWRYHNGGVQVFDAVFEGATGQSPEAYAAEHLWSKIGSSAAWNHDPSGNPTTYAHVLATCRDHARFGYLYLRGGAWSGGQVVPASFVEASLTPSQEQNRAYGYLWWLNGEEPAVDPLGNPKEGTLMPYAPPDLFAARGFGDQFIDVIPSLDMVVVRIGPDPTLSFFDYEALVASMNTSTHADILVPILEGITAP